MKYTAKALATLLNGEIIGNDSIAITHPDKIESAKEGAIAFLANPKYESYIYTTKASVVLVHEGFTPTKNINATLIKVGDVYGAVAKLLQLFEQSTRPEAGISSLVFMHPNVKIGTASSIGDFTSISEKASIGKNCTIYPQVYIGKGVSIEDNTIIYPGVKIYHHCEIGKNCIIHANAVIGSDGFGFAPQANGTYQKVPQAGKVIIEDNVEIGANTVIDRATMGATIIEKGTKLDNLIQVAHNVSIGQNTVIAAQAGIAGSTRIGNNCQIGGQAGFVGHIEVADGVKVQAQSGVAASIKQAGSKVYGYPALSYQDYLRAYTLFRQLPDIEKRIRQLEKKTI